MDSKEIQAIKLIARAEELERQIDFLKSQARFYRFKAAYLTSNAKPEEK